MTVDLLELLRILESIGAAVWSILAGQVEVTASLTGGVAITLVIRIRRDWTLRSAA